MRKNLERQFESIKNSLRHNVSTIRQLLKELNEIECVIQKLGSDQEEIKASLKGIRENISDSIDALIEHTKELFAAYELLIAQLAY